MTVPIMAKVSSQSTSQDDNALSLGANLIENSDCKTCHNETQRTVGPSYVEIAANYPTSDGTIRELSAKIIEGGSGNWGEVPMTAHPDLMESDAGNMIRYILSLDEEEGPAQEGDLMLGKPTIPINQSVSETSAADIPGLATHIYLYEEGGKTIDETINQGKPIISGISPSIHIVDRSDFGAVNTNIIVEYTGSISVQENTNVDFRLVSDDGSYLFINDKLVIDNGGYHGTEARDGEVILDAGKNDIRVVYFNGEAGAQVSLQWAPHGAREFEIAPSTGIFSSRKPNEGSSSPCSS